MEVLIGSVRVLVVSVLSPTNPGMMDGSGAILYVEVFGGDVLGGPLQELPRHLQFFPQRMQKDELTKVAVKLPAAFCQQSLLKAFTKSHADLLSTSSTISKADLLSLSSAVLRNFLSMEANG